MEKEKTMEITAEVTKTSTGRASLERVNTKRYAILSSIAKLVRDSNIASSDVKDRIIMAMTTTSPVNVLADQEWKDLLQKAALSGSTGQLTRRAAWRKTREMSYWTDGEDEADADDDNDDFELHTPHDNKTGIASRFYA
jgi:hypothetical protein